MLDWQIKAREVWARYPFLVVNGGVYTGKTAWGAAELLDDMIRNPGKTFWWVAGLDWQIKRFWEEFAPRATAKTGECRISPHCFCRLANGARMYGVTSKSLDSITAFHPWAIYCDETAKFSRPAWNLIRVRMVQVQRALLLSTPRVGHWEELMTWGKAHRHKKWGLVEVTTKEGGLVTTQTLKEMSEDLPEELYQQEFEIKMMAAAGAIFKRLAVAATVAPEESEKDKRYIITYDPAKHRDFGVASVWRGYRQVQARRWRHEDYKVQARVVADLACEYNFADVVMDAQGPGEAVLEMLEDEASKRRDKESGKTFFITPVRWDNTLKGKLVNDAIIMFERGQIALVDAKHGEVYAVFIDEHRKFERGRSASGLTYTYNAPEGGHDDCVSCTLLRMHDTRQPRVTFMDTRRKPETDEPERKPAKVSTPTVRYL